MSLIRQSKYGYRPNPWCDPAESRELVELHDKFMDQIVALRTEIEELKKRIETPIFKVE